MAAQVKVGSLTGQGSTGNQSVTGLGFQPKAVLFFWPGMTADGTQNQAEIGMSIVDGTSVYGAYALTSEPGGGTWSARSTSDIYWEMHGLTGSTFNRASFVSLDPDGFTINWLQANTAVLPFVAFGGDISARVKVIQLPGSTGNQSYSGLGFQPKCLIAITEAANVVTQYQQGFGFGTGSTSRGTAGRSCTAGNNVVRHSQSTDYLLIAPGLGDTSAIQKVDIVSLDPDGFTLNWIARGGDGPMAVLALATGSFKVGEFSQRTSTGTQAITGVGFQPKLLFLLSANDAIDQEQALHARISWGAGDLNLNQICISGNEFNTQGAERADGSLNRSRIIESWTEGTPTLNAAAALQSMDADGFTLNWTVADATARKILYLAIGDLPIQNQTASDTLNIALAESAAKSDVPIIDKTATDELRTDLVESAVAFEDWTATETLLIALTESAVVQKKRSATDNLAVALTETAVKAQLLIHDFGAAMEIEPGAFPPGSIFRLEAHALTENSAYPVQVRLFNVTDGVPLAESLVSTNQTSMQRLVSGPLALANGPRLYKVQFLRLNIAPARLFHAAVSVSF